jgi:hypothetical protein
MLRPTVSRPAYLDVKPHLGHKARFLLLWDIHGFVEVGRPLWQKDGSVVNHCCWTSPTQSFLGSSPAGLLTTVSDSRLPNLEGQVPVFISPSNMVTQLYPQVLHSLFVASYDSQGCGGGIRNRLHTGIKQWISSKLYIKLQSVPHRKHITSPLQSTTGKCCLGKQSLFVVRTIRNTQIHCVGRMKSYINVRATGIYNYQCSSKG